MKQKLRRAVVIFIEDNKNEFTDFQTQSGYYDLSDILKNFDHQYLHFDRPKQFCRETQAIFDLLPRGALLEYPCIQSRLNNLRG